MNRKLLLVVASTLLFGLGIVVYGVNFSGTSNVSAAADCCGKGESCPMRSKGDKAKTDATHESCCMGGSESCPMDKKENASGEPMKMGGHESCPMMKKDGAMSGHPMKKDGAMADHPKMMADGESCPMMKGAAGDHKSGMNHDMKMGEGDHKMGMNHDMKMGDGKSHACPCCKADAKKDGSTAL